MAKGTIKWFNMEKGFGFIEQEGAPDVYFNRFALKGIKNLDITSVKPGATVEFTLGNDPDRTKAYTITSVS